MSIKRMIRTISSGNFFAEKFTIHDLYKGNDMKLIKIDKKSLKEGIDKLKRTHGVFGPVREKDEFEFKALGDADMPDFSFSNTRMSP